MKLIDNVPVFGHPDPGALAQIQRCAKTAARAALMADHHKGYGVPIGGVLAYRDSINPAGVGYDIGCGNLAVQIDLAAQDVLPQISRVMDEVVAQIGFGVGGVNPCPVDHPIFNLSDWGNAALAPLKGLARDQLGTVGSGNHFVDIFSDEDMHVWVGVHFGSRKLGHHTATYFLNALGSKDDMDAEPVLLEASFALGQAYIQAMQFCGMYAALGRELVVQKVLSILGATASTVVHNHHNFAWEEEHGGEKLWVVRKGATPCFPGQSCFVGGSLGEESVILEGVAHEDNEATLCSTVHGAGRVMGRRQATGIWDKKTRTWRREPLVTQDMLSRWVEEQHVELRGAGVDESPHCYKRLSEVLREQGPSVRVLHALKPLGVAMA